MKRTIIFFATLFPLLFLTAINSIAQKSEVFDLATFTPPETFEKQANENSLQFSKADDAKGTYCVITLVKSLPGPGSSRENFDSAWQTLVKEKLAVAAAPQMQPANNPEDWKAEMGSAPFEKDGLKGAAVLVTLSGYGRMFSIIILTNSESYEPSITSFLESVSLKAPQTQIRPVEKVTYRFNKHYFQVFSNGIWCCRLNDRQNETDHTAAAAPILSNLAIELPRYFFSKNIRIKLI